ncbi:hypothetical protein ACE38V_20325 [Cytobacillus sp. Hz8]|uniref:hypothetical protein n=1 Tax=Cytobacillus sp. Hz8 TaxID=3347168 RepID=UPI0035D8E48F
MKSTKGYKILSSAFALSLILGTTSIASAKSVDHGKQPVKVTQSHKTTGDQKKNEASSKQVEKKKVKIQSKVGKSVEKRLITSETSIQKITKSINTYFQVNDEGTAEKDLSKSLANSKYNSYKGKLKAEINKLKAIDKQLSSYKKKYKSSTAEFDALAAKSKELQTLAADEIERVKLLAKQASTPETTTPETGTTPDTGTTTPESGTTTPETGTTTPETGITTPDDGTSIDNGTDNSTEAVNS